jgi:hypothetical protein
MYNVLIPKKIDFMIEPMGPIACKIYAYEGNAVGPKIFFKVLKGDDFFEPGIRNEYNDKS